MIIPYWSVVRHHFTCRKCRHDSCGHSVSHERGEGEDIHISSSTKHSLNWLTTHIQTYGIMAASCSYYGVSSFKCTVTFCYLCFFFTFHFYVFKCLFNKYDSTKFNIMGLIYGKPYWQNLLRDDQDYILGSNAFVI